MFFRNEEILRYLEFTSSTTRPYIFRFFCASTVQWGSYPWDTKGWCMLMHFGNYSKQKQVPGITWSWCVWLCLSLANPGILGFAHVFHTDIMFFGRLFGAWHEGSGISACEKSLEWQRSLQLMLKLSQRSLEGNPGFKHIWKWRPWKSAMKSWTVISLVFFCKGIYVILCLVAFRPRNLVIQNAVLTACETPGYCEKGALGWDRWIWWW